MLATKVRLLRFDGQVLEVFNPTGSDRYHVSLVSDIGIDEKKKWLTFAYGRVPQPQRIQFEADELAAVAEFMRDVVAAAP